MPVPSEFILYVNDHFRIEHAVNYRIAGFLFVAPVRPIGSLAEMTSSELALLGPTLRLAVRAVEQVLEPLNVYCTKFGESGTSLHFHIFPRTDRLTKLYMEMVCMTGPLDGPGIMSWANRTFIGDMEHGDIKATIQSLKEHLARCAQQG